MARWTRAADDAQWSPYGATFQRSSVSVLCYFTYLHELDLELIFLHLQCIIVAGNVTEIVIKILPVSAGSKNILSELMA